MTDSDAVYRLLDVTRAAGLTVHAPALDLPPDVLGRVCYGTRQLWVAAPSARAALIAVAHELGHWAHYRRTRVEGYENAVPQERRERAAYLLGWGVLRKYAPGRVSKVEWRMYHGLNISS